VLSINHERNKNTGIHNQILTAIPVWLLLPLSIPLFRKKNIVRQHIKKLTFSCRLPLVSPHYVLPIFSNAIFITYPHSDAWFLCLIGHRNVTQQQ